MFVFFYIGVVYIDNLFINPILTIILFTVWTTRQIRKTWPPHVGDKNDSYTVHYEKIHQAILTRRVHTTFIGYFSHSEYISLEYSIVK